MRNILIMGGTGVMGSHLVQLLNNEEYNFCYVTSRSCRKDYGNVKYLQGNAHSNSFLDLLLHYKKWDAIIDFMIYEKGEFEERVEKLLDATNQLFFLSSARVYADSEFPITEDSPRLLDKCDDESYLATDEYALEKARHEDLLFNSAKKNWTIIRPYITYH